MGLASVWKPWFLWRPAQAISRARRQWAPASPGYQPLELAWGLSILADPARAIGRSIDTTGVYDLSVTELLARLIRPGDVVVDAGANVGYMTLLASVAAGPTGRVVAWEPHPDLHSILCRNVRNVPNTVRHAGIDVRQAALADVAGETRLAVPRELEENDGLSYIDDAADLATAIPVRTETLDGVLGAASVGVMKIDVEGAELRVLAGARRALEAGRIGHIVFEDHVGANSEVLRYLSGLGYEVRSIGWSIAGLQLGRPADGRLTTDYEPQSFVATLDPEDVRARCRDRGWRTLRASFARAPRALAVLGAESGDRCA